MDIKRKTNKASNGGKVSIVKKKTPVQLADSLLQSVLNATLDTLYTFDLKTRKAEFINLRDFLGYTPAELISNGSIFSAVHEQDRAEAGAFWAELPALKKDQSAECEIRILSKSNVWEWVRCRATTFIQNEAGTSDVVLMALSVISDQKRLQEIARQNALQYEAILKAAMDGFWVVEVATQRIIEVNDAYCQMSGYSREEILQMTVSQLDGMEKAEDVQTHIQKVRRLGSDRFETFHIRKNGSKLWLEVGVQFLPEKDKTIAFLHDITESKQAEEALRESEARLKFSQRVARVGHWTWDTAQNKVTWSDEMFRIFGLDPVGFTGDLNEVIASAIHPEDREKVNASNARVVEDHQPQPLEYRVIWQDGSIHTVWAEAGEKTIDESGNIVKLSGIVQDITERKNAEKELLESQRNEHIFLDTLSEGAALNEIIYDENGVMVDYRVIKVNPAYYKVADFQGMDVIGKTATELYKMPLEMITGFWKAHREKNEVQHTEMLSPLNGKAFYVSTSPFVEDKFVTAFFDMTELKNAQAELAASRDMFQRVVEQIPLGIQVFDTNGLCVDVNEAHCQIFGATREQLVNQYNIFEDPLADTMGTGLAMRRALKGESVHLVEQQFDFSKADPRYASGAERVLNVSIIPIFDSAGKVANVVGLNEDISAKKRDEDRIRTQVQRLSALRAIDAMIKSSLDLKSIIEILLNETVVQLNVDAASLLLFNKETMMLEHTGNSGFRNPSVRRVKVPISEGYAGHVILNRKLIHIPNLSNSSDKHSSALASSDENFVSYVGIPLVTKGQAIGVLEMFSRKELNPDSEWFDFLENLADQAAIAVENVQLFSKLQRSNFDMILAYDATIEGWSRAMDLRDRETDGHTQRITSLCVKLARALNMRETDLAHLRHGALLHDIGNLGVPDHVLLKTEELNEEEREAVRKHPALAYDMLKNIAYLKPALDIPYCHHERWDGSGYPRGLKGEEIPLSARIFAVVDVWDALRSRRPYREAWSRQRALDYIRAESGKHFDPRVVEAFLPLTEEDGAT